MTELKKMFEQIFRGVSGRTKNAEHVTSKTERNLRDISSPMKNNRNKKTNQERSFHRNLVELFYHLFSFSLLPSSFSLPLRFREHCYYFYFLALNALILRAAALSPEFIETISCFFQHFARCGTLCRAWNHCRRFQYMVATPATSYSTHATGTATINGATLRRLRL